ncbi:MAG: exodeoxyribonuclease III [Alphaproteobacteria bacterium]
MVKIATYNANSLRIRLDHFIPWLGEFEPDIVLIQETKVTDDLFPVDAFKQAGYHAEFYGQKSYNGVAILSKHKMEDVIKGLPNFSEDENARVIAASINGVRYFSLYCPNGNPIGAPDDYSEKFTYKLDFMARLYQFVKDVLIPSEQPFLLGGDFNICPLDIDCYDPAGFKNDALCQPQSRHFHQSLIHLGLADAWRTLNPAPAVGYSYWDYQGGRFFKDDGLRIDHFLLSPALNDRLLDAGVAVTLRQQERPSDHTPVWITLK